MQLHTTYVGSWGSLDSLREGSTLPVDENGAEMRNASITGCDHNAVLPEIESDFSWILDMDLFDET